MKLNNIVNLTPNTTAHRTTKKTLNAEELHTLNAKELKADKVVMEAMEAMQVRSVGQLSLSQAHVTLLWGTQIAEDYLLNSNGK